MHRDCLRIIESKSKVRHSRSKAIVSKVGTISSTPSISPDVAELKDMVKALLLDKKNQSQAPATLKAVEESCVTCGGAHSYRNCPATGGNVYRDNIQEYASQAAAVNYNQGNTGYRPPMVANQIRPPGFPPFMNTNTASTSGSGSLPSNTVSNPKGDIKAITTQSGVSYNGPQVPLSPSSLPKVVEHEPEPVVTPVSTPKPYPKPSIPYPSRLNDQKIREKANNQIEKFYQIFQDLHFDISFADALILMPKFASTLKSLIGMDECLALADLGASINLMPLSVWKKLSLPELTPTCMTLELADRSIPHPIGIAEDVDVKVGKFQFLADFVVIDFDADPRVPLILRRSFLKTGHALIDVYEGELTLRVGKEAVTFNLDQLRDTPLIDDMNWRHELTVIEMNCEGIFMKFSVLRYESRCCDSYYDPEGDILLLEAFLNDDPSLPPPTQGNYLPEIQKELKVYEAKTDKSSIDEPPEVELKDLPPHLEYTFLEGDDKLPVIIAKDLSVEEKAALIKVLKSHKRAIAWKPSNIKGINPKFCTHKILMEEDYKPAVQHQRWVNPKIHDVIKKEVEKLLDAKLIYPISDSPWKKLTEAPILIAPDWDLPFALMCDASDFAIDRARSTSLLGFDACQFFDLETAGDHRLSWIFEASRARGFVLRSQELQILSFIWEIQYPNLID
ncbi:reverse transcriptase domain-containing protein [Tanacetum coccineum]